MMDTHPYNAPMCFVVPTAEMDIKISMFIDHNGKIYLPYLHDWQPVSKKNSYIQRKHCSLYDSYFHYINNYFFVFSMVQI